MTVAELKTHAYEVFKIPVKDQRLLLTGRPLCGNYLILLKTKINPYSLCFKIISR